MLDHLDALASLLRQGPAGLFLDLDGTLAEIVPHPDGVTVKPAVKAALRQLNGRLALVAVVTGRPVRQALDLLGLDELVYVGNHGLERMEGGRLALAEEVRPFTPRLGRLLRGLKARFPSEGLVFEDKGGSIAVHYRLAADPDAARDQLLSFIRGMAGDQVKLIMGKTVINVLPPLELNKGTAVTSLVKEYRLAGALLMGDDVTDLDAFRAARKLAKVEGLWRLAVAVVDHESPPELEAEADYTLASVEEVERVLTWMAEVTR